MSSFPLPELPPYLTLLLTGSLSPACPLHLALAHLTSGDEPAVAKPKVIIVTARSQDAFERKLKGYDDAWLNDNSLTGRWADRLASIDMFYARTPAHLKLILSLLRPSSVPNSQLPGTPAEAVLDVIPSLIILHDISEWFTGEMASSSHVLSHYLELVAMGLDCARYLSVLRAGHTPIRLALIDGKLCDLHLPIVDRTPKPNDKKTCTIPSSDDVPHEVEARRQTVEPLLPVIAKYFEWIGQVERYPVASPDAVEVQGLAQPTVPTHTLNLRCSTLRSGISPKLPEERSFSWREDRTRLAEFGGPMAITITHIYGE